MEIENNLYDKLSQSSLDDWDEEYHKAFKSMDLNRIRSHASDIEELVGYMVAKINEVVWEWDILSYGNEMEVLEEDLEEWIEMFDIVELVMKDL